MAYLVKLGVMTKDGRVVKEKYDKFRRLTAFWNLFRMCVQNFLKEKRYPFWTSDAGSLILLLPCMIISATAGGIK